MGNVEWHADKALALQCIFLADRLEQWDLLQGHTRSGNKTLLILDRYYLSGLVYGEVDGLDPYWLAKVHRCLPRPSAFYLLDIPVEESVRRRPDRADYFEKNLGKQQKVRELYLKRGDIKKVDGMQSPEVIAQEIASDVGRLAQ
jgi:thymidylate kinase